MPDAGTNVSVAPIAVRRDLSLGEDFERLARRFGVPTNTLARMMRILAVDQDLIHQLGTRFESIAEWNAQFASQLRARGNSCVLVEGLWSQAAASIEMGEYEAADNLLVTAGHSTDGQANSLLEAGLGGELDRNLMCRADILVQGGELARAQLRYFEAAKRFADAGAILSTRLPAKGWDCLSRQAWPCVRRAANSATIPRWPKASIYTIERLPRRRVTGLRWFGLLLKTTSVARSVRSGSESAI